MPVVLLMKALIQRNRLHRVQDGGLPSFAVTSMVFKFAQTRLDATAGCLLYEFCNYYSTGDDHQLSMLGGEAAEALRISFWRWPEVQRLLAAAAAVLQQGGSLASFLAATP